MERRLMRDPAIMTTDELRQEIVNTYHFLDIDGLNWRQLSEVLRQLRAGHRNPVVPVILPQDMDPAEMSRDDIINELCNVYQQNRNILNPMDIHILVALLESFRLYGYNPILLRHAIDGNMVAFDEHVINMRNNIRQGGRKRKSKQRVLKNRRSNRRSNRK